MDALAKEVLSGFDELHERLRKVLRGLDAEAVNRAPARGENSIAVLITHTLGSELGWMHRAAGISFKRDRDSEFRAKASPRGLRANIDATERKVRALVRKSDAAGFGTVRRFDGGRRDRTVGFCVLHALVHATEHAAHAELTRNLLGYRPK